MAQAAGDQTLDTQVKLWQQCLEDGKLDDQEITLLETYASDNLDEVAKVASWERSVVVELPQVH